MNICFTSGWLFRDGFSGARYICNMKHRDGHYEAENFFKPVSPNPLEWLVISELPVNLNVTL